jgi:hypothetical protein
MDTDCRCYGLDRRSRCTFPATNEDGYCDVCRCEHGCCENHGNVPGFFDTPPAEWWDFYAEAAIEIEACHGRRKTG